MFYKFVYDGKGVRVEEVKGEPFDFELILAEERGPFLKGQRNHPYYYGVVTDEVGRVPLHTGNSEGNFQGVASGPSLDRILGELLRENYKPEWFRPRVEAWIKIEVPSLEGTDLQIEPGKPDATRSEEGWKATFKAGNKSLELLFRPWNFGESHAFQTGEMSVYLKSQEEWGIAQAYVPRGPDALRHAWGWLIGQWPAPAQLSEPPEKKEKTTLFLSPKDKKALQKVYFILGKILGEE